MEKPPLFLQSVARQPNKKMLKQETTPTLSAVGYGSFHTTEVQDAVRKKEHYRFTQNIYLQQM